VSKIPPDAFDHYVGLGQKRSYEAVAKAYGVTKTAVTKRALKEDWQGRLAKVEAAARSRTDDKLVESIEQMNERHLKILRAVIGKALQALQSMPITSGMDAVRALDLAIRQERTIRGEPSDRSAVAVEDIIRREYERWMRPVAQNGDHHDPADAAG
jgi:hypothetical protein